MGSPIRKVVIVGASSAGLLSAVALKQYFPALDIQLLYSKKHAPISVGESTTAWFPQFIHNCLNIERSEFYRAVWPIWKLGIRFEWGDPNLSHFNYTFDRQFINDVGSLSRHTGYYCMHDIKHASPFSILMDKGHAPLWLVDKNKVNIVPDGFGYHIGVQEFSDFLFQRVKKLDIQVSEHEILDVIVAADGSVQAILCEDGLQINADLFIDATGFKSILLGQSLREAFISFKDYLFCDSAIVGSWKRSQPILPYTTVTTLRSGWKWRIDLRERVSFGYVYASDFCSQEEALREFLQCTPNGTEQLRRISFKTGRYQRFWVKNVIAVGNSSGFVEPLESTGQHMIAETIWRVILTLQDCNLSPSASLVHVTNQYIAQLWDEIRDFLALHFRYNRKLDTPFWQYCQEHTPLGSVQALVDLYREDGMCRALSYLVPQHSIFEADGYLTLLCGQRLSIQNQSLITSTELQEWHRYRQSLAQEVSHSLTPEQAFQLLDQEIL